MMGMCLRGWSCQSEKFWYSVCHSSVSEAELNNCLSSWTTGRGGRGMMMVLPNQCRAASIKDSERVWNACLDCLDELARVSSCGFDAVMRGWSQMVVHVGMCAHRISRDLWLKDHHGMGREVVLRKSTYRGKDAAGGWRGAREEEFSPDRRELRPPRPCPAPVFLAWNGKLFNVEIEPSCRSCVQTYPSFRPRSDWGVAGVGLQC